jgi:hypothetical protein
MEGSRRASAAIDRTPDDTMKLARCLSFAVTFSGACLVLVAAQEPGQDSKDSKDPKTPQTTHQGVELPQLNGMQDDQKEMIHLFHEVERTLGAIDLELADAGAGRIPVPEGKESGIERLLHSQGEKSDQAVTGIERILELAEKLGKQGGGQCMKAGMKPPEQSGESPLDKERQRGPTERENTPQAPKPDPKQGEKPESPKPEGQKPDDRGPNPPPGENRPSPPRVDEPGQPFAPGQDSERWGNLPQRVRQVFQNQIRDDLPIQYRDWIDSYYRRLNKGR